MASNMAEEVTLNDCDVWDDSYLINTWDEAVAEYKKYHSIQKSGRRIEDISSNKEIELLHENSKGGPQEQQQDDRDFVDMLDDQDGEEDKYVPTFEIPNRNDIQQDKEKISQKSSLTGECLPAGPEESEAATMHNIGPAAPLPQALLDTVQDENIKNIMMSWYYAGYYTGIHVGQQEARKSEAVSK